MPSSKTATTASATPPRPDSRMRGKAAGPPGTGPFALGGAICRVVRLPDRARVSSPRSSPPWLSWRAVASPRTMLRAMAAISGWAGG